MKRILLSILAACVVVGGAAANAAPVVTISDWSAASPNATVGGVSGGAFKAVTDTNPSGFMTFCLELNESVTLGAQYKYRLDTAATNGGVGGATNNRDEVSSATKWLYIQAISGKYTSQQLDDVQLAIWKLEGELTGKYSAYSTLSGDALALYNAAITNESTWASLGYTVGVMNLYTVTNGCETPAQSMLYYEKTTTPPNPPAVPEPASMLLLGSGLVGLAARMRRRKN